MATNEELLARVYSIIGSERDTAIMRPMVLAMATLAFRELAINLIDADSEMAKKLSKTLSNQTWHDSQFDTPADMLFHKWRESIHLDINGVTQYPVQERNTLTLISGQTNGYYALEGTTFYLNPSSGTGGANLNITYYKIPTISDIDAELMNPLLEILIPKLIPVSEPNLVREGHEQK